MRWFRGRQPSIRGALTRDLIFWSGLNILLIGFLLTGALEKILLHQLFDEELEKRAQALVTLTKEFDEGIELDYAGEFMPEFESPEGPEYFEVWLPNGTLLERSESLGDRELPVAHGFTPEPVYRDIHLEGAGLCRLVRLSFLAQKEDADVDGSLSAETRPDQAVTLLLARKRETFDNLTTSLNRMIWAALVWALVICLIQGRYTLNKGLKPLEDLRAQVKAIDPKQLDARITLEEPVRELRAMVDQLNTLLERLESAVIRERRFTSDVAHELRTPLAELRSLVEVGAKDPEDTEMVSDFFGDVREVTLEMQGMVSNLLELTRCDTGARVVNHEPVNLATVIGKAWTRSAETAQRRRIKLDNRLAEGLLVSSDGAMMDQIIQNLISNAVTYSPRGSTLVLESRELNGRLALAFTNPAPQLEEGDLSQMFNRFWQKDASRTGSENAGLGLSIVESFAGLLGMDIKTRLYRGNLTLSLIFPPNIN
ncbi:MAG: histidine kinase dimerization/phospho-acceptor domain-containing protein [Acidobacteriota bacterium]|nr:histidine kinase dimerization/phospho-acceptor domain-containing protein [Acidobacteriota bacterium]